MVLDFSNSRKADKDKIFYIVTYAVERLQQDETLDTATRKQLFDMLK